MNGLVKWNGQLASLRKLEKALARDEQRLPAPPAARISALAPASVAKLPPRVDLLRVCAQHGGNPWMAVYLLNAQGGYDYSTSVAVSKTLYRTQYAPGAGEGIVWDGRWIDEETCALCGVAGLPVRCGGCARIVCRGRSSGQYFRCACGSEGWLQQNAIQHLGVIPRLGR
jgi:hypothetical protein